MSRGDPRLSDTTSKHRQTQPAASTYQERWYRQAYRQMVEKDSWKTAKPVDEQTQMLLEAMPEQAEGRYFKDPYGKYREVGPQQREKPDVMAHRIANVGPWLERLPGKGATRYVDLANLDADFPHPGEDEQVAAWIRETRLADPHEDYFGTGLAKPADENHVRIAKAPPGGKVVMADVPHDQMPQRAFSPRPSAQPSQYGRTGRVTTQPRDEMTPVTLPDQPGTPSWQRALNTMLGLRKEFTPPSNFATPAPQPYPSAPGGLSTEQTIHALDLQPEELKTLRWDRLADRLKSRDNYDPRDFSLTFKNQEPRQNARRGTSPEVAAQDAIDAAHELNLAKGRDWGTDLPRGDARAIMGEYDHAVETLVKEAGDFWSERVRRAPLASEIEMMRAYVRPRIIPYFPADTQALIRNQIGQEQTLPIIQDGPQGARELITALVFGEIRDVTINGEKIDLPTATQTQIDTEASRRYGSHGGLTAQRLNYLIGQEVKKCWKPVRKYHAWRLSVARRNRYQMAADHMSVSKNICSKIRFDEA